MHFQLLQNSISQDGKVRLRIIIQNDTLGEAHIAISVVSIFVVLAVLVI